MVWNRSSIYPRRACVVAVYLVDSEAWIEVRVWGDTTRHIHSPQRAHEHHVIVDHLVSHRVGVTKELLHYGTLISGREQT